MDAPRVVVREAAYVERLAYTRTQAATALGISRSTFIRRVLPFVETIETGWGTSLIPVDEVERFLLERRRQARATPGSPTRWGRRTGLPKEIIARIHRERADGRSLGQIARGLSADGVPTSQGGRQWWPSTIRAVLAAQPR
ncbi:MAG TPA: recombinase family protein [Gaiellaceae bacterium]|nr:recombinase family protein [Gaiellaceae bacterium]